MRLKQAKRLKAGHVHVEKIRDAMKENTQRARIPPLSYGVDLRNRRCESGMFQTLWVTLPRIKGCIDMVSATACVRDVAKSVTM
ncbi:hypothetical protein GOBAR_DD32603 [Gossypium barbadense]|nr:hypothetical protein GOBAR_DD32603 [Gossypium barbadense]